MVKRMSDARSGRQLAEGDDPARGSATAAQSGSTDNGAPAEHTSPAEDNTPAEDPTPATSPAASEPSRADRILRGLGYCGHYLHFHGGGRSGREPILCKLHRAGGSMSQLELGSQFELKAGSLSEILAKIEAAGLIERTRDPRDRRALTVRLTEAGTQEAERAFEAHKAFRDQAFSNLTDDEQDELITLLEKIRNRWEELA